MTHFCQAHQELRDTNTTIDELGFQSANTIVEKIVERLREVEENELVIYLHHLHLIIRQSWFNLNNRLMPWFLQWVKLHWSR